MVAEWPENNTKTRLELGYIEDWTAESPGAETNSSQEMTLERKIENVRIDEAAAKTFSQETFDIHFVNGESGQVLHTYVQNYSSSFLK